MAIAEKLAYLEDTKKAIKDAIVEKGTDVPEGTTFRAYADKVREIKSGSTNEQLDVTSNGTYNAPEGIGYSPVVVNVPQDGAPTPEELTITGDCNYRFANGGWDWVVNKYGNQMTTKDITSCESMFVNNSLQNIPFDINCQIGTTINCEGMFQHCSTKNIPKFSNCKIGAKLSYMFSSCENIVEFPKDFEKGFDYSEVDREQPYFYANQHNMFDNCYRLRHLPIGFLKHGNPKANYNYSIYDSGFKSCKCLDEIIDLPNPHYNAEFTSNAFSYAFDYCSHLKDITFASTMTNGQPNKPRWNNQSLHLINCGYSMYDNLSEYGLPAEKKITNDASYQKLKNDNDAWTMDTDYSRYNHDSAVRTINSLPDTSAFISEKGGTNTITFQGCCGKRTDGGAISTLTPEEIAVATAKGWTVSLI